MKPLVRDPSDIRIALVGMVPENCHPYSWSAVFNGFDAAAMSECPEPIVAQYLSAEPAENLHIPGARVTHIWCEDGDAARHVAKAGLIPHPVGQALDVIGQVDAVIIPTDIGAEHLERARPFVEAGVPVFIDKPLVDNEEHLRCFARWHAEGKPIMSSSVMRYAGEYASCRERAAEVGALRLITMTSVKSWERYGIHAAEAVYPFLAPGGWEFVVNSRTEHSCVAHLRHRDGVDVVLSSVDDMYGAFGCLALYGTKGTLSAKFADRFTPLKAQLQAFVSYLRTGHAPFPFSETVELMKIIIAGIVSGKQGGRRVQLSEIEV